MDNLEELIAANRPAFDSEEPSDEVWATIREQLQQPQVVKKSSLWTISWVRFSAAAAATAFLMVAGTAAYHWGQVSGRAEMAASIQLEQINPQMAEVERYYTQMISLKEKQLSKYDLQKLGLQDENDQKMAELDSTYKQLKHELEINPNQQKVLDAMTRNLQMRMLLLSRQLEVLQHISKQSSQENENIVL